MLNIKRNPSDHYIWSRRLVSASETKSIQLLVEPPRSTRKSFLCKDSAVVFQPIRVGKISKCIQPGPKLRSCFVSPPLENVFPCLFSSEVHVTRPIQLDANHTMRFAITWNKPVFGKSTAFEWSCASSKHAVQAGPLSGWSPAAKWPFAICYDKNNVQKSHVNSNLWQNTVW